MRVLHLIDGTGAAPAGGGDLDLAAGACGLALRAGGDSHEVWLVGTAAAARRLGGAGVGVSRIFSPPLGEPALAWRGLRLAAAQHRGHVLQCWGAAMLDLSRLAFPTNLARVAVAERRPAGLVGAAAGWMGAPVRSAILVCPEGAEERARSAYPGLEVMGAPPPCEAVETDERGGLRRRLGLEPGEVALLLAGRSASAMRFVFLQGLLACAGQRVTGVMPAWASQMARGRRMRARAGRDVRMIVSDLPMARLAAACDAGVLDPGGAGPTSHRQGPRGEAAWEAAPLVAAGLPTVAPEGLVGAGVMPGAAAGACLAQNATLPELARLLCPLLDDAGMRGTVGRELREHARAAGWGGRFVGVLVAAWKESLRAAKIGAPLPRAMFTSMGVQP
ncbi:MAG: hypothetical protein WD749_09675 [Phycisphaerales bacterium]